MIFTTPEFALFFVLFFAAYAAFGARHRKTVLLAASYLFYGSWNWKFLALIIGSTLLDFYVGRRLGEATDPIRRKRLVTLSVVANLAALGFFKYCNFFIDSAVTLLDALGLPVSAPVLEIVLPVGISFYTFQTMSYTIDIYRGKLQPTDSLRDFALYVAFFPQLVAGPIERAAHLLPQLARIGERVWRADTTGWGLIAIGCFKKVVIADNIAELVNLTYADPDATFGPAMWIGTYAFAIQIYCDFSGYSDIAVGIGRLLGLDIVQNFAAPYAANGPSDFWRRWHISLSTWLRDYLYIPLGGNRDGAWRTRRNLMLTMLLGGLWHGAAWNFVLWGAFHGLLLVAFRPRVWGALAAKLGAHPLSRGLLVFGQRLVFFHLVCLSWALFRATSLEHAVDVIVKLLDVSSWDFAAFYAGLEASGELPFVGVMMALAAGLVLLQNLWPVGSNRVVEVLWRAPRPVCFALCALLLYLCMLFAPESPPPFIYFQF